MLAGMRLDPGGYTQPGFPGTGLAKVRTGRVDRAVGAFATKGAFSPSTAAMNGACARAGVMIRAGWRGGTITRDGVSGRNWTIMRVPSKVRMMVNGAPG
jgi:hypothetical protein